ncbi:MAG TPA: TorF family putative porin [Albitalea sp.]|nr:TorF family putative porin [Albitalea sp.]
MLARVAALALLAGMATSASAQTAASVTVESDYRFRGVSLSNLKPDLRVNLAHDDASGWYAGASGTRVQLDSQQRQAALFVYGGFARRALPGLAWEIGATAAHLGDGSRYDYGELFGGVIGQRWNARAYVSPSYFGSGTRTLYAELNGGLPLVPPLRLFGHVGALWRLSGGPSDDASRRARSDVRVGLAAGVDAVELQLAWVRGDRSGLYPIAYGRQRSAWVLSAAYFF